MMPSIADIWRCQDVRVGQHQAPPFWQVPQLIHSYARDLEARLAEPSFSSDEQLHLIDDLAFAEWRLLWMHPFVDFNGRVSRLFLAELLCRKNLQVANLAPLSQEEVKHYSAALLAYDQGNRQPLCSIWRHRFEQATP